MNLGPKKLLRSKVNDIFVSLFTAQNAVALRLKTSVCSFA